MPLTGTLIISRTGNFLQPILRVSKASEPAVRCSRRSSSDSASFSPDLSLRKPLRPRLPPAEWMARIRSGLLERLKNGMSRSVWLSIFSHFATTYTCFNNKICEILKVAANWNKTILVLYIIITSLLGNTYHFKILEAFLYLAFCYWTHPTLLFILFILSILSLSFV